MRLWGTPANTRESEKNLQHPQSSLKIFTLEQYLLSAPSSFHTRPPTDWSRMWSCHGSNPKPLCIKLGLLLPGGIPSHCLLPAFVDELFLWAGREGLPFVFSQNRVYGIVLWQLASVSCLLKNLSSFSLLAKPWLWVFTSPPLTPVYNPG